MHRLLALSSLTLLTACLGPVEAQLHLDNDGAEPVYVNGTHDRVWAGLQEQVNGEFRDVWWSPDAACMRECGAPGGPIACIQGAAEFGVVWAIQPGDRVTAAVPETPWVQGFDAFGECVKRTALTGELRSQLCQDDEFFSQEPLATPTETGPVVDGFDNSTWLEGADCAGVPVERDGGELIVSLGEALAG